MKIPQTAVELILSVWPDLTNQEAEKTAQSPQNLQKALYHYTQQYTQYCVEELAGFHLSDLLNRDDYDFRLNFKWTNPFLKVKPFEESISYTLGSFLLTYGYFSETKQLVDHLISFEATPEKISEALQLESVQKSLQQYIFSTISPKAILREKQEKTLKKKELDACLSVIGQHIGYLNMFGQIFQDTAGDELSPFHMYSFDKHQSKPVTLLEMCVQNNLPLTALNLTKQLFEKENNPDTVISLFETQFLQHEIQSAYTIRHERNKRHPLTQLVDYLENILPSDKFIQLATGKNPHPYHSEINHEILLAKMQQNDPIK